MMWFCIMFFIQMSINVYFCHEFVFVSIKTLHKINVLFFHDEWGFVLILIYLSGVVSEWGFARWGLV